MLLNLAKVSTIEYDYFIKMIAFNYIIGNCDAHAKNFSIIHDFDLLTTDCASLIYKFAPFYDLISTKYYPNVSTIMGMYIGTTKKHGLIKIDSLAQLAKDLLIENKRLVDNFKDIIDIITKLLHILVLKHSDLYLKYNLYQNLEKIININSRNLTKQVLSFQNNLTNYHNSL